MDNAVVTVITLIIWLICTSSQQETIWHSPMSQPYNSADSNWTVVANNTYFREDYLCPNYAYCWQVCGQNTNNHDAYIYRIISTEYYQDIKLQLNVRPIGTWGGVNESCQFYYNINNNGDSNWIPFYQHGDHWNTSHVTKTLNISTSNNIGVGIKILALDGDDDCCNLNDIKLIGTPMTHTPTTQPTTIQPTTSYPTTSHPTTYQPTTVNPTTSQPTTPAPTTSTPTTPAPSTSAPTTSTPTTSAPTTSAPTTSAPTTSIPTTSAPTTSAPTTATTTTSVSTSSQPTTSVPTTYQPTTYAPSTTSPTYNPTTPYPINVALSTESISSTDYKLSGGIVETNWTLDEPVEGEHVHTDYASVPFAQSNTFIGIICGGLFILALFCIIIAIKRWKNTNNKLLDAYEEGKLSAHHHLQHNDVVMTPTSITNPGFGANNSNQVVTPGSTVDMDLNESDDDVNLAYGEFDRQLRNAAMINSLVMDDIVNEMQTAGQ